MNRFTAASAVLGIAFFVAGTWLIYRPAGLLVLGAFLIATAVTSAIGKR